MSRRKNKGPAARLKKGEARSLQPIRLALGRLERTGLEVDADAGTITGVSVITLGPALGHEFDVDDVMLDQVVAGIQDAANGMAAHWTHAWEGVDTLIGRFERARRDGDRVRADFTAGVYADKLPGRGDVRGYLMGVAAQDPEKVGLSILYEPAEYEERTDEQGQSLRPAGRIKKLLSVDFVGDPAANPGGLLHAASGDPPSPPPEPEEGESLMNPKIREYLVGLGLKADATDAEALEFQAALTDEQKAEVARLAAASPPSPPPPAPDDGDDGEAQETASKAARKALADERKRVKEIRAMAAVHGIDSREVDALVDSGATVEAASAKVLEILAKARPPIVTVGGDLNRDSLGPAVVDAVLLRAGVTLYEERGGRGQMTGARIVRGADGAPKRREATERGLQLSGLSLIDIARQHLAAIGVPGAMMMSRTRVADLALSTRRLRDEFPSVALGAQGTSDFDYLLEDAMGKSLRAQYVEAEKTWPVWVRRTTNTDLKDIKPVALSEAPDLAERKEGGEVVYGALTDSRETYVLVEYAKGIILTRRAIINDDTNAFGRIPGLQAAAAARKEDDVVYTILTANAALADTIALFDTTHKNTTGSGSTIWYLAGDPNQCDHVEICFLEDEPTPQLRQETVFDTGDVKFAVTHFCAAKAIDFRNLQRDCSGNLTVATLGAARARMRQQRGPAGAARLSLTPRTLIVPSTLETTAEQLIASIVDPSKSNATPNPFANRLKIVCEPRIDP